MEKPFCHLHVHTPYSLLDGFAKIDNMVDKAVADNMTAIAITDHGSMFGVIEFYKKAKEKGINPIIGCEVYVSPRTRFQKENIDKRANHLVLLAMNNIGYQNIIKLVSIGYTEGFYYKPRVDIEVLRKYSEGIICLSACLAGKVQQELLNDRYQEAKKTALEFKDIYGEENFYLEVQDHGILDQQRINPFIRKLSKETGIPIVVTNDVHYVEKNDDKVHDVLMCIQTNKTIYDEHKMEFATSEFYFKTREEMYQRFEGYDDGLLNTQRIADRCDVSFDFNTIHLPEYKVENGMSPEEYLRFLGEKGLKKRYGDIDQNIRERFEYEFSVIVNMGYVEYFLIVWDFINYAKTNNIMVGPGRGSAAGSIIAYVLEITDVDPLEYNLLFERFLNPERISMPDVDIDFCYERREKVIDYVKEKYGEDHVAQIITFGTLGAKAAIRDVGRVMAIPYSEVDKVAKEVPYSLGMTIEKALDTNPILRKLYESDEKSRELIDMAKSVEGLPRHASTHAAGVVISKKPVDEYVPLYMHQNSVTTQFTMGTLEKLGLLKMDFLGLRTLTVIQDCITMVKENHGVNIDLHNMKYNDPKVFKLISQGNTLGVFQLESNGMRSFMQELKPENFEDIVAGISLYRPGPMESIPTYIKSKNNAELITYLHPKLKPILSVTRGIMIYQEQVMQVVRDLGGYSYARADLVRKAMSKKQMDVMEMEREYFVYGKQDDSGNVEISGCVRNGVEPEIANKIYDSMIDFAKYAFNKSHAACYGVLAYETAYLKSYYPLEFMAALITSVMSNSNKVVEYVRGCAEMKIKVLGPDINLSSDIFSVEDSAIRFGLVAVKGIGVEAVRSIERERKENGLFLGLRDFINRMINKDINKKLIENLIKAGAFDTLEPIRASLLASYEIILDGENSNRKNNIEGQLSFFKEMESEKPSKYELIKVNEFSKKEKLMLEKEVVGLYISGHPLEDYGDIISKKTTVNTGVLLEKKENYEECQGDDNMKVIIGGIVASKTTKITKRNEMMGIIELEDLYGSIEVIVFPKLMENTMSLLQEDQILIIEGRLSLKEDEKVKILAEKISELAVEDSKKLYLRIPTKDDKELLKAIEQIIKKYPGDTDVIFFAADKRESFISSIYNKVKFNMNFKSEILTIIEEENVKFQ
ncbi:MAG: DNA polymerase III subunit alpha [Filifactoraceae bacterium]